MTLSDRSESRRGVVFGIAAYGLWGLIPLYFKSVTLVAPTEVLAHRALWSFVLLAAVVGLLGQWGQLWRRLRDVRVALMLGLSAFLIAMNWLTFIYAVQSYQVVQSSLGYFIAPLVNVLLGVLLLRERLRPFQMVSIVLAAAGVVTLTGLVGQFPWIALALAFSMAFYGLLRKTMPVDSLMSITVETLAMAPCALAYLGHLGTTDQMSCSGFSTLGLLMLSGPVTTIPLLFFGGAARRLRLSTLGFLQYLTPSMQFLLAVVVFREPFAPAQLVSFACIWAAVLVYVLDSLRAAQQNRVAIVEPD